ncbi:ppp1r42 [Symbiodinium sp. CCMP2456]|nr:ppp1r42 [Symbiodinium sp. CCMP2456]
MPRQFCPDSLAAIAPRLNLLNAAGNHLQEVEQLSILRSLTSLDLSENKIAQVGHLRPVLTGDALRRLNLSGNPFASAERRYRTAVVLCSNTVEEIDGKEILPQERDFVRRLDAQKRKLSAQRQRHLNRVTSDGRPRPPNMSDKARAGFRV